MGFRFRRRFTIEPGLRINVSKSGISYTQQQSIGASPADDGLPATSSGGSMVPVCIVLLVLVVIAILIWMR